MVDSGDKVRREGEGGVGVGRETVVGRAEGEDGEAEGVGVGEAAKEGEVAGGGDEGEAEGGIPSGEETGKVKEGVDVAARHEREQHHDAAAGAPPHPLLRRQIERSINPFAPKLNLYLILIFPDR